MEDSALDEPEGPWSSSKEPERAIEHGDWEGVYGAHSISGTTNNQTKTKKAGLKGGCFKKKWSHETGSIGEAKGVGVVWDQTKGRVIAELES